MGVLKVNVGGSWTDTNQGPAGGAYPAAGAQGQLLTKSGNADYATQWAGPPLRAEPRNDYVADTAWHEVGAAGEPAFQNGWMNYIGAAQWETLAFRVNSEGWVFFKGLLQQGTASPIFTLPPAYRPWKIVYFPALSWNGQVAYIYINVDGTVNYNLMGGTNQWLMLSMVRYPLWNTWKQFDGRYIPLEGIDLRTAANYNEIMTGLYPQPSGMTKLFGISGGVTTAGSITDLNNAGGQVMSYLFGAASNDTAGGRCFQISKKVGFQFNGPQPASTWTMFSTEFGTMKCEDKWITPTLLNGWVPYGANASGAYTQPGYWMDTDGVVHLRGLVQTGSSANANILVLPPEYRPPRGMMWFAGSALGTAQCRIDVQQDGVVRANTGGSTGWNSMDGINFYAIGA
jgi:hypothetical protein